MAAIVLALPLPLLAQVDPKVHKLCLDAKDYHGCVKAMTGDPGSPQTVIQENFDAGLRASGNSCPEFYAYAGAGWCRKVVCSWSLGFSKHDPSLAGKGMKCPGGQTLSWVPDTEIRASIDPSCPNKPMEIGYQSTCQSIGFPSGVFIDQKSKDWHLDWKTDQVK